MYRRNVESAEYDQVSKKWIVKAKNVGGSDEIEKYFGGFLVVATGETTDPYIPQIEGLSSFNVNVLHSTKYKSGKEFENKNVLLLRLGILAWRFH
ncbi:indole-3-pyruvate monooxygenase YUCCA10 [Pyrus ussuriensis x Pyrus communis]|uniref:Flavin-containing monooxygenase n=1 Tax=Pyrus ussuriensis x Pyrus communis TaxID=2448454 RepID=A0A5N5GSJ6_9ROSA|nr:indole-3-pyruvate monooxygenase YUCCA10 [Pyrus ussuriensis x Pyrus communis]